MRRTAAALVVLPLAVSPGLLLAAPASAADPTTITVDVPFDGSSGTFTADGGGLCSTGSYQDSETLVRGSDRALTFHLDRTFVCSDGSGTFTVRINAHWHPCDPQNAGTWVVLRGTGEHAALSGAGRLVGTYQGTDPCEPDGIVDVLTGRVGLG